jgi:small neutral amino acid transporter SnatA (MarC family)
MTVQNYLLMAAGVFTVLGAAADWDWFMNNRRAALFVRMFGRDGARVFYVLLGLLLVGIGAVVRKSAGG